MTSELKKLYALFPRRDHFMILLLLILMIFGAMLEVIGIGIIPLFVAALTNPNLLLEHERVGPWLQAAGIEGEQDLLVYGAGLMITAFAVKNLYLIGMRYLVARFAFNRFSSISLRLFTAYMHAPYTFHLKRNSSELLRNTTQESQFMTKQFMVPLLRMAMDGVIIAAIVIFLLVMEPLITLMVIMLLGGGGGLYLQLIRKRMRMHGFRAQKERGNMIKDINEGLGGLKDAKVLNRESWFTKRLGRHVKTLAKTMIFKHLAKQSTKPVLETIAVGGILMIALLLFWQDRGLATVIPVLTLFGAATVRLMPAWQELISAWTQVRYYAYTVNPIYDDLMQLRSLSNSNYDHRKKKRVASGRPKMPFEQSIVLDRVTYTYPGEEAEAIRDISLEIPKGSSIGFVGESGAGKTTIVDLILGLLKPDKGVIRVDGTDIWSDISAWQRNIGYIPQFIYLMDDTIRKNIAFGLSDEEIDEEQLHRALTASHLHQVVNKLPEGDRTIIGERGVRFSGGQRQRIGIARALYHNPQLLIMDEATSALDNKTEKQVISAIEQMRGERTIIMIAHRLTTVENCNRLYLLKDGYVKAEGDYNTLANKVEEFKEMNI